MAPVAGRPVRARPPRPSPCGPAGDGRATAPSGAGRDLPSGGGRPRRGSAPGGRQALVVDGACYVLASLAVLGIVELLYGAG